MSAFRLARLLPTRAVFAHDLTGLATLAAITAAAYFIAVRPRQDANQMAQEESAELDAARLEHEKAAADNQHAAKRLTALRSSVTQQRLALEPIQHANRRLAALTNLAGSHGVRVAALTPGASLSGPRYAILPISLAGSATWESTVGFIGLMHDRYPDTALTGFSLAASATNRAEPPSVTFDLAWYAGLADSATSAAPADRSAPEAAKR
ncbi:hypothetical protein BH11PLA1_BH11PLA1_12190 [soil metagenome]